MLLTIVQSRSWNLACCTLMLYMNLWDSVMFRKNHQCSDSRNTLVLHTSRACHHCLDTPYTSPAIMTVLRTLHVP